MTFERRDIRETFHGFKSKTRSVYDGFGKR
jgi:hypothetical protein